MITLTREEAQPEPEPVAFMDNFGQVFNPDEDQCYIRWKMRDRLPPEEVPTPLYTASPQREWVGLTDGEINAAWGNNLSFARAIEAKLKEKNT
jgi:hypothetical protein